MSEKYRRRKLYNSGNLHCENNSCIIKLHMVNQDERGFWRSVGDYLTGKSMEVREGSVNSAGGTSPLPGVIPPARTTGPEVTVDTALSLSAVYRAINILYTAVSQLEMGVWRGKSEIASTPALVSRPDINNSPSNFLKRTTIALAATGNCYWRIYRASPNDPIDNLEVLNPQAMNIVVDDKGNITYEYNGYVGGPKTFQPWQIKHLKLMETWSSNYGLGPIQACRLELRGHLDLRQYSDNWFQGSSVPTGVLSTNDYLNGDQADEYKARWQQLQTDRSVAVLGNGLSYQPILLNPEDAQFIQNQSFSVTQVSRLFGIPASYMLAAVDGSSMTYTNLEQINTVFLQTTLFAYLREIEEAFSDLLPRGQRARFKVEGFLRADDKTRAEVNKTYLDMGVLSREEVRISEGWGPLPPGLEKPPVPQSPNAAPPQSVIPTEGDTQNTNG